MIAIPMLMMSDIQRKAEIIKEHIKGYPDFPKPGVLFRDIFSILQQPDIFSILNEVLLETAKNVDPPIECVVGLDARGFIFGPLIALELKVPFVPIRKKGKLPGKCESVTYSLEYGEDCVQIQVDSIKKGQSVLIVDDLLATGGTLRAAVELVKKIGASVSLCLTVIELEALKGRDTIPARIESIVKY